MSGDNRLTAEQIEELQKSRSRDDDYDVIVPGSAVPLNASDVEQLVSFYKQDVERLKERIEAVKARCTHMKADGTSAGICDGINAFSGTPAIYCVACEVKLS